MSKKIGIGIIGEEHWYWSCACAYGVAVNPNTKFIGMAVGTDKKLAERIAKAFKAEHFYEDYRQLLKNPEIDSVIITTTTDKNTTVAIEAAKAGKNILINKPIARTLIEADKIIEASERNEIKVMVIGAKSNFKEPALGYIEDGVIGKPYAAHASVFAIAPLKAPGINEPGWFVDPIKVSGGGFIDHAVYLVGRLEDYFGSTVSRIYAEMGKFKFKNWKVEDHGIAIARFSNGGIATIEATFTAPVRSYSRIHIIGTDGEMEVMDNKIKISSQKEGYKDKFTEIELLPPNPFFSDMYLDITVPMPPFTGSELIDEYTGYILNDEEPIGNARVARRHLEACLAAYKSVEIGSPVNIPYSEDVDVPGILNKL